MSVARILDEDKLSLEEARPLLGTGGKPCDFATIYRAVTAGHLLPNGERLKLEAARIGGKWVTSRLAIERYVIAMTAGWTDDESGSPTVATKREKSRRLADAEAALAARGI
jgi:hypothetical protein